MKVPEYTVEDMQSLCKCFDSYMWDFIYSEAIAGTSFNHCHTLERLNVCENSVPVFLSFLKIEYGHNSSTFGYRFYEALMVPFDRIPTRLGDENLLKEILRCRLALGK